MIEAHTHAVYVHKTKLLLSVVQGHNLYNGFFDDAQANSTAPLGMAKAGKWYGDVPRWARGKVVWIANDTGRPVKLKRS